MFFKILNLIFPFVNVFYLYYINLDPSRFYIYSLILAIIHVLFLAYIFVFKKPTSKAISNIFAYILFLISSVLFFIFIKNDYLKIILYFVEFIISLISIAHIRYLVNYNKENYFFNDVDFYIFLFSSFLISSSFFAFNIFLDFNKFLLTLIIFIYFFVLYFCIYYYHAKNIKDVYKYVFASSLISSEFFVAVSFLPYSFYVNASIVLLVNYFISSVSKDYLANKFNSDFFKKIGFIVFVLIAIILITAKRS